jgi:hypothetical protein
VKRGEHDSCIEHSGQDSWFGQRTCEETRLATKLGKRPASGKVKAMHSHPSNGNKCQEVNRNGQGCEANAMTNSKFCFFHDPSKAKERAAARRAGGVQRSRRVAVLPPDTPDRPLRSSSELLELLRDMMNKILRGELDPKIGYSVGYLATIQARVLAQSEMEERLAALEAIVKQRPVEPDGFLAEDSDEGFIPELGGEPRNHEHGEEITARIDLAEAYSDSSALGKLRKDKEDES